MQAIIIFLISKIDIGLGSVSKIARKCGIPGVEKSFIIYSTKNQKIS